MTPKTKKSLSPIEKLEEITQPKKQAVRFFKNSPANMRKNSTNKLEDLSEKIESMSSSPKSPF